MYFHVDTWPSRASASSFRDVIMDWCDFFKIQIKLVNLPRTELRVSCISGSLAGLTTPHHPEGVVGLSSKTLPVMALPMWDSKGFSLGGKGSGWGVQKTPLSLNQLWFDSPCKSPPEVLPSTGRAQDAFPEGQVGMDQPAHSQEQLLGHPKCGWPGSNECHPFSLGRGWHLGEESSLLGFQVSVQPLVSPEWRGRGKREKRDWLYVSRSFPPSWVGLG